MIKKGGIFLLFFILLKAEYAVVLSSNDYQKLHNMGVVCAKQKNEHYICYKSDDKFQLKRFSNFAKQNGVNAKIVNILNKNLINIYSIQILSTKNKKRAEKYFQKYKKYPYARIEKIGPYYTIRIGASKNRQDLKELLKKINKKNAFIRKADIKLNRIIDSTFMFETKNLKKFFIQKHINEQNLAVINEKNKKFTVSGKTPLNISVDYFKNLQKAGNLKKSCEVYTVLSLVKKEAKYEKLKNDTCYRYHIKNLKKLHSDFDKMDELINAMKYKKTNNDILLLNYYKAKTFQTVDVVFLDSLNPLKLTKNQYGIFLKTLLYSGEILKINYFCKKKKSPLCQDIKNFFYNKKPNDKDILALYIFVKKIENNINAGNFQKANEYIQMLYNINKNSLLAKIYNFQLNVKKKNFKKADKILSEITSSSAKDFYYLSDIIENARKIEKIIRIDNYLKNNDLINAQKEIIPLIRKYPDDFEVNILAGDVFDRLKSYMANFYYHKAYLKNKKRFFYHLLKIGNYKRLKNYINNDLKQYPEILSIIYFHKAKKCLAKHKIKYALRYALQSYNLSPSMKNSILLGKIYYSLKDYKNCVKYLEGFANNDYLKYYLGYSYFKLGDKEEAEKYLSMILNTKNEDLQSKLISVYLKMGKKDKVKELLKSF